MANTYFVSIQTGISWFRPSELPARLDILYTVYLFAFLMFMSDSANNVSLAVMSKSH